MTSQENDIRITKISKKYGSPEITRDILKMYLTGEFVQQQLTTKYGLIHSIRMPFAQDTRGASYFGFITMANAGIHEKLLKDLAEMRLIFGDMELMFEKAASRRSPYPPGKIGKTKRKWDSTEEEEVVVTSIRTDASVNLDEDHKVKDEPVEPTISLIDREHNIRQREEDLQ